MKVGGKTMSIASVSATIEINGLQEIKKNLNEISDKLKSSSQNIDKFGTKMKDAGEKVKVLARKC